MAVKNDIGLNKYDMHNVNGVINSKVQLFN